MRFSYQLLFLLIAVVCFALVTLGVTSTKVNLTALGFTCFALSFMVVGR